MGRSNSVNGVLIRSIRSRLGWTQETLANRAKLSLRVIAKAESGQPIASATLARIEGAFRDAGEKVSAADLCCNPLTVVAELLAAYRRPQQATQTQKYIAKNITTHVDGDRSWFRVAGEHRGIDAFERVWSAIFGCLHHERGSLGNPTQMLMVENHVVAWGHEHLGASGSRADAAFFILVRLEFSVGLVAKCWLHFDPLGLAVRLQRLAGVGRLHGELFDSETFRQVRDRDGGLA